MKNFKKGLICAVISFAILFGDMSVFAYGSIEKTEYDSIIDGSVIMYAGSSAYYQYGKKYTFSIDDKEYIPIKNGTALSMPVVIFKNLLGIKGEWNRKRECVIFDYNGKKVSIRVDEDAIYADGEGKYIKNYAKRTDRTVLLPFEEVLSALGFEYIQDSDLYIISDNPQVIEKMKDMSPKTLVAVNELFESYIYKDDFSPDGSKMTFQSWNGDDLGHGFETDTETKDNCGMLRCPIDGFEGYRTARIQRGERFKRLGSTYKVSFSVKVNESFDAKVSLATFIYNKNVYQQMLQTATLPIKEKNKWVRYTFYLDNISMPNNSRYYDSDEFEFLIRVHDAKNRESRIWVDDVRVVNYFSYDNVVDAHMIADKFAAWYQLGDTVVYEPKFVGLLSTAKEIIATVYDYDGNMVCSDIHTAEEIIKNGWTYTPEKNGYYEVAFDAVMNDGMILPIVDGRSFVTNGAQNVDYTYTYKHSFFVTQNGTKDKSERNDTLYFSFDAPADRAFADDYVHLADMLGFHGNRLISLDWGERPASDGGTNKGVESTKGVFDWSKVDSYFNLMDKYGFVDKIICIMTTPRWATVPDSEITDSMGRPENPKSTTSIGNYIYNNYLSKDPSDWVNFVQKCAERYKGKVKIWEIWNEPMVGKSAFWYDTPKSYVTMLEKSYDAIKAIDKDAKVSTAGMGNSPNYTRFLEEMIKEDPNVLNKMDYYAAHGNYDSISVIRKILDENGKEDLPWINTEGYYGPIPPTETSEMKAAKTIINYLMQYKMGAKITTFFTMLNVYYEIEDVERRGTEQDYSPFRYFPYIMPKKQAAAMHTFFELMEKNFAVDAEYEFDNGIKGVLCKNGDKNLLIVWQPSCKDDIMPKEAIDSLKSGAQILCMDGRGAEDDKLYREQVRYLTDVDALKLEKYKKTDTALNVNYVAPQFKCMSTEELEKANINSSITMTMNEQRLFDANTMQSRDDIEWVEDDYEWQADNGKTEMPVGFRAKHAVSIDETGFYLMVDVSDKTIFADGEKADTMWARDNVQFSVKVNSESASNFHEFSAGLTNGQPVVYKHANAFVLSDQPPTNFTKTGILTDAKVAVEKNGRGLLYKIFIPAKQMWPYVYNDTDEYIRVSVCVNNNDGDGRIGWLQWSRGIASGGKNSSLFGYAYLKKQN